jgi:hypothetical protein
MMPMFFDNFANVQPRAGYPDLNHKLDGQGLEHCRANSFGDSPINTGEIAVETCSSRREVFLSTHVVKKCGRVGKAASGFHGGFAVKLA